MLKSKTVLAALFAAFAFGAAAPSFAGDDERYYEQNRAQFITYEKAAQTAVAHVGGGVATDVDFEHSVRKGTYFEVEVRGKDGREYDVKIDAKTGKVLSSKIDY
ncbi:PepSY domain-containing protein [Conchiformibius kuhniae]|uniref:PepSY domain-containing protein n=1 Tax=Conchiformibius kuhniae TaxID=211502 RepID=A0A8T9MV21_9NEIS|nr:PepSY domain-containing protein [Conchiformibius kuhniae]